MFRQKVFWLDICAPTEEEMKMLANVNHLNISLENISAHFNSQVFSIHPLTTEDIQTYDTREKFELYASYYFISKL